MTDWSGSGTPAAGGETSLITVAQADAYMVTRLGATAHWSALSATDKLAALTTAEAMLGELWTLEDTDAHRNAICEQALFLARDPLGVEARMNLQAQGVTQAGIVQEAYRGADAKYAGIAPRARKILDGAAGIAGTGTIPWER